MTSNTKPSPTEVQPEPVTISAEARRAMSAKVRKWSGWRDGTLVLGKPTVGTYAECNHVTHTITADPERLILNPNRVLLTVTPFRLRQEAVLTGALLHEAAHARYSHWKPRTKDDAPLLHSDGTAPSKATVALATLMEEARIEGFMALDADTVGAKDLAWTMRAMAARLVPPTDMSDDPDQATMDVITSWALRAGRQIAIQRQMPNYRLPSWVHNFNDLLHTALLLHLEAQYAADDDRDLTTRAIWVRDALSGMVVCDDNTGPEMIDSARDILAVLFPQTPPEDQPEAAGGSCAASASGAAGDPGESGEGEEGDGSEDGSEAEEGSDEGEDPEDADEPGDGDSDGESDPDDEPDPEPDDSDDDTNGDTASALKEALSKALAGMEQMVAVRIEAEATTEAAATPPMEPGMEPSDKGGTQGGSGPSTVNIGGRWSTPTKDERDTAKGAERFLREMIDASESSKRSLTDQPSAVVDGAALSAWKAGGQVREPHFFVRTRREVEPSPPIKIAILVDVSSSMDDLQEPSALLSWALSNAALDLRNFAGRGTQVESCLIHWGDSVETIQLPGQILPGIRRVNCNQGTSNMHGALRAVEKAMPGFFDVTEKPVNRLLVQFTDWKLFDTTARESTPILARSFEAGVNMLSVVPASYTPHWSSLPDMMRKIPIQRGSNAILKYDKKNPGSVWDEAARVLDAAPLAPGERAAPFPGF